MKIGVTYDVKDDWKILADEPEDANAEFDKKKTFERIVAALEGAGHEVIKIGNVNKLLACLDRLDVDIVYNFCEGISGRNRESQVPLLLEMKGIPFVGSDALTFGMTLDKVMAKRMFIAESIPTPRFFVAKKGDELKGNLPLNFPLIVKTRHEGSSKGINEKALVEDFESLKERVEVIHEIYKQDALVEEFIEGTEFTVAVLGNEEATAMPVVQTSIEGKKDLGKLFYTNARIYDKTVDYLCPAPIDGIFARRLQNLAERVFQLVEAKDFGRVDFRVNREGNPFVLEINPLPSLDEEDVFNIFPQLFGSNFDETINLILNIALKRYQLIDEVPNIYYRKQEVNL